jgi:DNA (cytosine-5)-methyltransferase 1
MISHVEYYRPQYFMLENVEGMLDYPIGATLDGRSFVGGIKKGVLKFILASLTSLGSVKHLHA